MKYPTLEKAMDEILDIGQRMYVKGFVAANDGNITCKLSNDTILATPTGISKGFLTKEMLVIIDLDGNILEGTYKTTSEIKMHLRVFKENENIVGVVHAHPPLATAFSIAGIPLDSPLVSEAILIIGTILIAPYAKPGTYELPNSIAPYVRTYNGVMLANHGALTWGVDLTQAWYRMEVVEQTALITKYVRELTKSPNSLSQDQVEGLLEIRKRMGISTGGIPRFDQ
ncbi:class II aldolase/adducin family protein [uncultured Sphaerochaeta sp.]|uniref:class II aldolase/adducin family protein n=1 Tax=uncultured Sphaerochaeta sp. TaxID=886478 RepID=UPI002A0A2610|nr:class II aldolase/adducin family protein [uncultured Sphaerochaeta sp.]